METAKHIARLIDLSPSPYHVVNHLAHLLAQQGFQRLTEGEGWSLQGGGRYYLSRQDSSLVAFVMPENLTRPAPLRLCSSHTDSPTLKLKPSLLRKKGGYWLFDVAVYGSPILSTWFDRDLSLAGLVSGLDGEGKVHQVVFQVEDPITRIPNLAIHLNRGLNESYKINSHDEMSPIWRGVTKDDEAGFSPVSLFHHWLTGQGIQLPAGWTASHWDVMLYDCQKAAFVGEAGDLVASSRLDNQVSCFAGGLALLDHVQNQPSGGNTLAMLACFDHEEVGSLSVAGAEGNLVESVISRLYRQPEDRWRAMAQSWMLSVDNAHGCHPNYPGLQDDNHCPLINQGVVLKSNPNQRYATNAATGGYFKGLCRQAEVAVQDFAVRSDMACGSTVGPPLSARLGIATADIGIPTWAMHSLREVAGARDMGDLRRVLSLFYGSS